MVSSALSTRNGWLRPRLLAFRLSGLLSASKVDRFMMKRLLWLSSRNKKVSIMVMKPC
jgi:hypothetical protein